MNRDSLRDLVREAVREAGPPPRSPAATVALGADHGGFALKERLKIYIEEELGLTVSDCGAYSTDAVDYPDIAADVARRVARGECARGIVIDGAGIGSSMAANKIPGARAAVCHDDRTIVNSREHNDANVLCLGAVGLNPGNARRLVRLWLGTEFAGGRHQRRVDKVNALDSERGGGGDGS